MRGSLQPQQEKPKHYTSVLDDETIRNIGRYYKVDDKNFESLIRYIKSMGIPGDTA